MNKLVDICSDCGYYGIDVDIIHCIYVLEQLNWDELDSEFAQPGQ